MTDMQNLLISDDANGVRTILMQRPGVHNAFDEHLIVDLTTALQHAASDDSVRIVVLGGAGKSFSAGGDLDYMRRMGGNSRAENIADANRLAALLKTLDNMPKPTIARVHGAAFGGGVGLVCCCDIAIGSDRAVLSLSEVKIGLVPATIAPYVLRSIGSRSASRYFLTGERIKAELASSIGLLHQVVDADELDSTIAGITDALLANSPNAIGIAKSVIAEFADKPIDSDAVNRSAEIIADIRETADAREGLSAFLEKRKPVWSVQTL